MTTRTTAQLVTFRKAFRLNGVDRVLPAGEYRVDTDEDAIDGLSFLAWRRTSTTIHLPARSHPAGWGEAVRIEPHDLSMALERDAASLESS